MSSLLAALRFFSDLSRAFSVVCRLFSYFIKSSAALANSLFPLPSPFSFSSLSNFSCAAFFFSSASVYFSVAFWLATSASATFSAALSIPDWYAFAIACSFKAWMFLLIVAVDWFSLSFCSSYCKFKSGKISFNCCTVLFICCFVPASFSCTPIRLFNLERRLSAWTPWVFTSLTFFALSLCMERIELATSSCSFFNFLQDCANLSASVVLFFCVKV